MSTGNLTLVASKWIALKFRTQLLYPLHSTLVGEAFIFPIDDAVFVFVLYQSGILAKNIVLLL